MNTEDIICMTPPNTLREDGQEVERIGPELAAAQRKLVTRSRQAADKKGSRFTYPTKSRLMVIRNGSSILREEAIPKPVVLVDTREQLPWPLLASHPNWIAGERRATLQTGDYSVEGMENVLTIERKEFCDVLHCMAACRERFLRCCERLSQFRWKAIMIEASYEDLKSSYQQYGIPSELHPNAVCGSLDAIEAKFGIPIIYTSVHRELATERAASWLSKHFTYWWLEQHGFGRTLIDSDRL